MWRPRPEIARLRKDSENEITLRLRELINEYKKYTKAKLEGFHVHMIKMQQFSKLHGTCMRYRIKRQAAAG